MTTQKLAEVISKNNLNQSQCSAPAEEESLYQQKKAKNDLLKREEEPKKREIVQSKTLSQGLLSISIQERKVPVNIKHQALNSYNFIEKIAQEFYWIITDKMKGEDLLKIMYSDNHIERSNFEKTIEAMQVFKVFLSAYQNNDNYNIVKNNTIDFFNKHENKLTEYFIQPTLTLQEFDYFMNCKTYFGTKEGQIMANKKLYNELIMANYNTKIIIDFLQKIRSDATHKSYLVLHDFTEYCDYRNQIIFDLQDILLILNI